MSNNCAHQYYKHNYFIVFYDETGEDLLEMFDNVRDILKYRHLPITRINVNLMNVELYRALRRKDHLTRMLDKQTQMTVYLVNADDREDDMDT